MQKTELSIVIVSYNTKNTLDICLNSIFDKVRNIDFEIIVVDNNSEDLSAPFIKNKFKQVRLIENKTNLGFAKAVNQGLKTGNGNYFLILNPDTEIKNNAISKLMDLAKDKDKLAAVGPKLLNSDGTVQPSCYNLPSLKNAILEFWLGKKGAYLKYAPESSKPVEVEVIVGAAMFIPKKVIDKVGYLNERYFMYFEDLDWCRKARKFGFKIYWHPQAEVIHLHGAAASQNKPLAQKRLIESSKIYNGSFKYLILTAIIRFGQKLRNN